MRRWLALFFLVGLIGATVASSTALPAAATPLGAYAGWLDYGHGSASGGGVSNNDGGSVSPSLAVGPDGPIIAWSDGSGGNAEIYVRRWDGAAWVEMGAGSASGGGISNNDGQSQDPSLAAGPEGPIVAWEDHSDGDAEIYVRRWNGSAWVEMGPGSASGGGVSDNETHSWQLSLAAGPDGPVVAWRDDRSDDSISEIYVRRWDGAAWVEMNGSASGGGVSNTNYGNSESPSLAIGPDGPIVAWEDDDDGDDEIYVRCWDGAAWVEMNGSAGGGGVSNNDGESYAPSLAGGPGGPIVSWSDDSGSGVNSDIYVRRWDGAAWVEMGGSASSGGISNNNGWSDNSSVATGPEGPIVTWFDFSRGNADIYVRQWDGAAWVEMGADSAAGGGISNNNGWSDHPSLAVGLDGPLVAWFDSSDGDNEIYIRRWDSAAWVEMGGSASGGGISNNDFDSLSPSVAVGPNGPMVAWGDYSGGSEIYVRRWDGVAWVEMGGSASGGGVSNNDRWSESPSLAIGPDGPIVAWEDFAGDADIYIRRWDGSAWVEMGAGSASGAGVSNTNSAFSPSLVIGPDGPIVAWQDAGDGDGEIYVRRWNGSAWVEMGGSATGGGISNNEGPSESPALAVGPDGPIVAWEDWSDSDAEIYVRRWDGSAWVEMGYASATGGGVSNSDGNSLGPSLTVGPQGPLVAWSDGSDGDPEIYVRRWDGRAWVEMGTGSASGAGVSNNDAASYYPPSLAYGPDGPVIAWQDDSSGDNEIYVRRWDGSAWVEAGSGSADGGGVSDNDGWSSAPSLAVGPNGPIVAWSDESNGDAEIYVRSHFNAYSYFPVLLTNCFAGPNEMEDNSNDSIANGPLCTPGVYFGLPNDAFDYFMFETTAAGRIHVEIGNIHVTGMQLALYDRFASGQPLDFDTEPGDGLSVELRDAPPGRYYIRLYTDQPNPAETRPYTMQVTFP